MGMLVLAWAPPGLHGWCIGWRQSLACVEKGQRCSVTTLLDPGPAICLLWVPSTHPSGQVHRDGVVLWWPLETTGNCGGCAQSQETVWLCGLQGAPTQQEGRTGRASPSAPAPLWPHRAPWHSGVVLGRHSLRAMNLGFLCLEPPSQASVPRIPSPQGFV